MGMISPNSSPYGTPGYGGGYPPMMGGNPWWPTGGMPDSTGYVPGQLSASVRAGQSLGPGAMRTGLNMSAGLPPFTGMGGGGGYGGGGKFGGNPKMGGGMTTGVGTPSSMGLPPMPGGASSGLSYGMGMPSTMTASLGGGGPKMGGGGGGGNWAGVNPMRDMGGINGGMMAGGGGMQTTAGPPLQGSHPGTAPAGSPGTMPYAGPFQGSHPGGPVAQPPMTGSYSSQGPQPVGGGTPIHPVLAQLLDQMQRQQGPAFGMNPHQQLAATAGSMARTTPFTSPYSGLRGPGPNYAHMAPPVPDYYGGQRIAHLMGGGAM